MMKNKRLGIAAVLLLASSLLHADDASDTLHAFINDVNTLSARFEQTLVDADDNLVEESLGTLEIARPGRFRWSYTEPYEQLLVADGVNVWSYDSDLEQVTVKEQAEVLGNTPAILLGGGGNVLDDFDRVDRFVDRGTEWIRLRPKSDDGGFDSVDLGFVDGTLQRMIFLDSLGQSTLIALYDVVVNEPIPDSRFSFSPPPGTDVVGTARTMPAH